MASESQKKFLQQAYAYAREAGLSDSAAKVAVAQSALETGYGRSVKGNNYHGIKAGRGYSGKTQNLRTWEEVGGKRVNINDDFRAYDNPADSFRDWHSLVQRRWPEVLTAASFDEAVEGLRYGRQGGYATDSQYGSKLRQIVRGIDANYTPDPNVTTRAAEGTPHERTSNIEVPVYRDVQPLAAPEQHSMWQLQSDAWNVEQTIPWLMDSMFKQHTADPNWSLSTDRLQADLTERGLPVEQYAERFADTGSEAGYLDRLSAAQADFARVNRLQEAGMTGTALRIANQILDPVALAADVAVGSFAPQLVLANRGRRLHRVIAGAVGGAAGGFAAEGVSYAVNPHRDQMDLLMGTVFGFGVGGAVGALMRNPHVAPEVRRFQRAAQDVIGEYEGIPHAGSVGAAKAPENTGFLKDDAFELVDDRDFADTFGAGVRVDLHGMMAKSKNPVVKALSGLVQDGTGKTGGAINAIAPSEETMRYFDEWSTAYHRTYKAQLSDFFKETEAGLMDRGRATRQFNEDVVRYIRDKSVDRADKYAKSVKTMGDKIASLQSDILRMAQNPFRREGMTGREVFGFNGIPTDPHYVMRVWDNNRIVMASREYTEGTIEELVGRSMKSANPQLTDELIARTAKAFTRAITERAHGLDDVAVRALGADDMETLVETLTFHGNLDKADAEALLTSFRKTDDAGRDGRAKRRLLLDENFRLQAPTRKDGTVDEKGLGFDDLVVNDASYLFSRYARSMAGNIALARFRIKDPVTGELLVNGITKDGEWEKLKDIVRKRGADEIRAGKYTKAQMDADLKRLDFAYSYIKGRPVSDAENTDFGFWARMVRKYNFSRIMNQVGFAQVAEVGVTVGHLGVKAAFSQVPALRRMISQDGETILKSGLADDLEQIIGIGTDRLRAVEDYRYDDMTGTLEDARGGWREKVEHRLNQLNRATSEVSGMTQANIMLQRWTAAAVVQKFANMAHKGGKGMSAKRLADLGVDQSMHERIMRMFTDEGNLEYSKGIITGKKVRRLHIDRWSDKEAAEAFRNALYRYTNQLIQKNDIGNLAMWMSHPAAKLLMQFRTFMVGAYAKQTLKAVNFRDAPAAISALISMGVAGAVYVAQQKIAAIGRSDRKEYEDRRLDWGSIGAAAFSRAGFASVIPMLVDTGLYMGGKDGLFSHTRTTGQASNMFFGNPATGGLDDLAQAGRSLSGILRDGAWSQEEARTLPRVLPFGNAIPLVQGYSHLIKDLPERAPRDQR